MKESQKILANILAEENITVIEAVTATASFNVETRVLTIPMWVSNDEHSNDVFNLFLGHEVSHALYTLPSDLDSIPADVPFSYINVVEDIRIEKLIQRKYLGLIPVFKRGYKEIHSKMFTEFDPIHDSFINRINVFFKAGDNYDIVFSAEEQKIIDGLSAIETFEEVIHFAKLLKDMTDDKNQESQEGEEKQTEPQPQQRRSEEQSEEHQGSSSPRNSDEDEDESDSSPSLQDETQDEAEESQDEEEAEEEQYRVSTNENAEAFMKQQNDDMGNVVRLSKRDVELNHFNVEDSYHEEDLDIVKLFQQTPTFKEMMSDCKKDANVLYNEFVRKQAAEGTKRSTLTKTGVIDVNKLASYRTDDNIFLSKQVERIDKNHGVVMLLDISGSMSRVILNVLGQVITVALFCRKANIPFEVYTYSSLNTLVLSDKLKKKDFELTVAGLIYGICHQCLMGWRLDVAREMVKVDSIVSDAQASKMTDYDLRCQYGNIRTPASIRMSATPTLGALVAAFGSVVEMKERKKINIVNTMVFTDGRSHPIDYTSMGVENKVRKSTTDTVVVNLGKKDIRVDVNVRTLQKEGFVSFTGAGDSDNVILAQNKKLIDVVLKEYKKLGNMIYVYSRTSGGNATVDNSYNFVRSQLRTTDAAASKFTYGSPNATKQENSTFRKNRVLNVKNVFRSVSSCIFINSKVFDNDDEYSKITSKQDFNSTKKAHIVKALNAKSTELKSRKAIVKVFAEVIASAL